MILKTALYINSSHFCDFRLMHARPKTISPTVNLELQSWQEGRTLARSLCIKSTIRWLEIKWNSRTRESRCLVNATAQSTRRLYLSSTHSSGHLYSRKTQSSGTGCRKGYLNDCILRGSLFMLPKWMAFLSFVSKPEGRNWRGKRTVQNQQYHWSKDKTYKLSMNKQRWKIFHEQNCEILWQTTQENMGQGAVNGLKI